MSIAPSVNGSTFSHAERYIAGRISCIPVPADGSKAPTIKWKSFQSKLPTLDEAKNWWGRPGLGIAIICGAVSGGLEVIDFDQADVFDSWKALVEQEAPGLLDRLTCHRTPRPGVHVAYRCTRIAGNTKLAQIPELDPETQKPKPKAIIETRGEGGYILAPGCPPGCHETGRTYEHVKGPSIAEAASITPEERECLWRVSRSFNQIADSADIRDAQSSDSRNRAGDDFNARGDWKEILIPHGWQIAMDRGSVLYLRRPGKAVGWSATIGVCKDAAGNDYLAVFSSNAHPFEVQAGRQCSCYSKFAAFALLNHNGDFSAAAKALAAKGYGSQSSSKQTTLDAAESDASGDQVAAKNAANDQPPTRHFPAPIPASDLRAASESGENMILQGCIERGAITLTSALWKSGKSTFKAHAIRAMARDCRFCGLEVRAAKVLYVTEESETRWAERVQRLGIGDHVAFIVRPFATKADFVAWVLFIEHLENLLSETAFDLIVFDTLAALWPVTEENDASQVQAALMQLHRLTGKGVAISLVHHLRKADGQEATGSRGSGALAAFVDTILEFRRFNPNDRADRRRVITGYGRSDDVPDELVVELSEDGSEYRACGNREEAGRLDRTRTIQSLLPDEPPGWTVEQIKEAWPRDPKPARRTLDNELPRGIDNGLWCRTGTGFRGDPYRFYARPFGP